MNRAKDIRGVSLLYVEDEVEARDMVARALSARYPLLEIHLAGNGQDGLDSFKAHRQEIVLTDLNMPVLDGIRMAREIKELAPEAIIAAVTAHSDVSYLLSAIEIGVSHYVLKPIDYDQLFGFTDKALEEVWLKRLVHEQNAHILKLSRAVEQSQSMIAIGSSDGKVEYVNARFTEVTGFPPEEVLGRPLREMLETGPPDEFWRGVAADREWHGEMVGRKKNGASYHEFVSVTAVSDAAGDVVNFVAVKQDISELKRQEAEIEQLRSFLADIINSMPAVLAGIDEKQRITHWNLQAEKFSDLPASRAVGRPVSEVLPWFAPSVTDLVAEVGRERHPKSLENVPVMKEGARRYFDLMLYPLSHGGVRGAVLKVEDVSARVHQQEVLLQAEKMASVGRLAFGMAHEVNNPLNAISQAARTVERRLSSELAANREVAEQAGVPLEGVLAYLHLRGIPQLLSGIREATAKAGDIVNSMLRLSSRGEAVMHRASLAKIVDRAVEEAAEVLVLKHGRHAGAIEVVRDYAPGLPPVPAVAAEIEHVVLHLLQNAARALHANPPQRRPRIVLRLRSTAEHAVLEVEDNGAGMPEEVREHALEPFYSTGEVGEGTGLGLALCYSIVAQTHGGTMELASEVASGTCVTIRLPLRKPKAAARKASGRLSGRPAQAAL